MLVLPQGVQGGIEQTASYDAYTYLSKRLKAELAGNSQLALTIPFLSPGSLELPSSTGKSLDFVDAIFQPASSGDHDLVHSKRNTSIKLLPVFPFLFTD